jgi:hypothetical protein
LKKKKKQYYHLFINIKNLNNKKKIAPTILFPIASLISRNVMIIV